MTQNPLPDLLEKYREGTLSPEELDLLNNLTRRDEVFSAAGRRANGIIFRRVAARTGLAVAALLLVGAGIWMLHPHSAEAPLVAEAQVPQVALDTPSPTLPQETIFQGRREEEEDSHKTLANNQLPTNKKRTKNRSVAISATPSPQPAVQTTQTIVRQSVESIVICNNQCEADSVISDIRKFLSA